MSDHSFIPKANPKIVPPAIPAPRKESLEQENARLKAEVNRLRKAGDDMADHIQSGWVSAERAIDQWNAAKEGGQP